MNNTHGSSGAGDKVLAILSYHKIGKPAVPDWDTWFHIPEAIFANQLSYLRENSWQVIGLEDFLRSLTAPDSLPERSVLLTFDDGYRSMRRVALPLLVELGYPAVVFVPTDFIGGHNWFDIDNEPEDIMCDWDDLRELERCGVSVQSHGVSHRTFSELDLAQQKEELLRSKAVLEEGLGKSITVFAYPYGDAGVDADMQQNLLRECGYIAACLYGGGPVRLPISDPYRLSRVAMGPDTDLEVELERGTDEREYRNDGRE
ncbi:MAG TPA: polysaccharide deacetylase family protein [Ktedonobacteraceae bacterium]|jgi:peptidoglycan/xylan/chitin deacetylase (PgdA/CDA1 family)|nr:polysaccharide deacetylase family protein [Ktedonobacteraceae bacterium]